MQIEIFDNMVLYGRGAKSVGEQIGKTKEEAQEIIDKFFKAFPKVQKWINESMESAHTKGFVEDVAGRRRRLPDIQLPKYQIKFIDPNRELNGSFNPFIGCKDRVDDTTNKLLNTYKSKLDKIKYAKEYEKIQADALKDGIEIHSNTGFIAQAERQAVNCVDKYTQILTLDGWKYYNEISIGDKILSFNTQTQLIEEDVILDIYKYDQEIDAIRIKHKGFDCISTLNHRWPLYSRTSKKVTFETTEYISQYKNYGTKKIIRAADNTLKSTCQLSNAELYLLGMWITDGSTYQIPNKYCLSDRHSCSIVQSSAKQQYVDKLEEKFAEANIGYTKKANTVKAEKAAVSYTFYVKQPTASRWGKMFPNKHLTYAFVSTLSQNQSLALLEGIIDGDGGRDPNCNDFYIITAKEDQVDVFQYLMMRAGIASRVKKIDSAGKRCYSDKITNTNGYIEIKKPYFCIRGLARRYADVLAKNCSHELLDFAWCVRTQNSTWIARSEAGYTFITGNSRVQGGAATLTKNAMLTLFRDQRLRDINARLINTVHDEILLEAPKYYAEECSKLLSEDMIESAKSLVPVVPMASDGYITWSWYLDEYQVLIESDMKHLLEDGVEPMLAFEQLCAKRRESTRDQIYELVKGYLPRTPEDIKIIHTLD